MAPANLAAIDLLAYLLGLGTGLTVWGWQRSQSNRRIKLLLRELRSEREISSLSSLSQLSMAIASQQQVQTQLTQQLEDYKQVLNIAPIGYVQVDDENRLLWCNSQARELLGIQPEQYARPRLLLEVVRSYELDQLIEQTRNAKVECQRDWTFYPVSPDPSHLFKQEAYMIRGHGFPLSYGHVGVFLENRQEAITLIQQRDRWASDVAHELKTPLTSIRLVAETLQNRLEPPLRGWVDRLVNETIRLSTLVQDLLDLSQIDRGSPNCLNLKTTDLVELIHSAWMNLEPLARKKQLELDYSGPEHVLLQLDEPRMYRVLINLLDNSIKYSPPWQTIQVRLGVNPPDDDRTEPFINSERRVCLEVIDAGPGFTEQDLPYVFERFYRADPSRSRHIAKEDDHRIASSSSSSFNVPNATDAQPNYGKDQSDVQHRNGSGLGLAIVKQIVEAHAGTVTASNHPETGGAWLQVRLVTSG